MRALLEWVFPVVIVCLLALLFFKIDSCTQEKLKFRYYECMKTPGATYDHCAKELKSL